MAVLTAWLLNGTQFSWAGGDTDRAGAPDALVTLTRPDEVRFLRLVLNKSRTLRISEAFGETLIANPKIADVVPLTDKSLYIVGKRLGLTRLTLVDPDKKLIGIIEIEVSFDVNGLAKELARSVPGGDFQLRTANGRIILDGIVPDAPAIARAIAITEQFTVGCQDAALIGDSSPANVSPSGDSTIRLQFTPAAATPVAGAHSGGAGSGDSVKCYVNALKVRAPQQVLLEVRFVEAQRSAARNLGLAWDTQSSRFRGITGASPGALTPGLLDSAALLSGFAGSSSIPFGTFVARLLDSGTRADLIIQALEQKGLARRLAEPNLVTLSGDTANFLAGGEFPFPVQADDDRITLEFKKFGVGLAFTPTVLSDGQINLQIEPEVSDLDPTNSFQLINGVTVPALVVRRAKTTVELRDGQSFAIAGLLQTKHIKNLNQLPWIGNVPVLGPLFRSSSYEKEESDLVIIVTPHLVKPAAPGQKLQTPLDQAVPSNDRDFFLSGRLEIPKHFNGPYGHIIDIHSTNANSWITREEKHAGTK